jgi:hypothetical protein
MLNREMGDLRNKRKHLEDLAHQARQFRQLQARSATRREPACLCGLTHFEARLWQSADPKLCQPGVYCLVCAPLPLKQFLIGDMVNNGIPYDAGEHGE